MAKIYVSSTYLDLKDYREQVERVIRRMGHTDVAMEYYVAEDTRPTAKCVSDVAACDVYVGIFAWRYGWQPTDDNPDNLSITEMEFRQAEKTGKPCFIFLLSDDAPWPRKHMDKVVGKIETLRNTASAKHTADYFTTPDELARKVAEAIYKQIPAAVSIPEYNLTTYYEALRKRYNVLALEGLTPPQKEEYLQIQLSSVFVEQSVREDTPPVELPKEVWEKLSREQEIHDEDLPSGITLDDVRKARDSYYQKPSRLVLDALTDSRSQYTIVLGDPGSGKSTLARYVMLSLIDPMLVGDKIQKTFEGYLPLLIELRTFAGLCDDGKCETPLEFLEHLGKTEGWGLTQTALHNHLKNDGRAVVIFDGLDEIFEPKMRETITNQIVGFTNMYPKARVIVTSRILGYRRKILSDAGFTHFTLQDLDEKQVDSFITKWYQLAMSDRLDDAKERSERILKSFADSASIRQLAGNPMLLTIMAIIGKHQELPRERWKLYDHAASVLIQHWDVNKHLKDENLEADFIGEDDKKELLRRLAYRMQNGDGKFGGNYIDREGLQEEFESYLKERYSQAPDRAKIIAEAMIQQFRERNFILSLYGANVFGFVHRAFLEYFCASAFTWRFEKTKELTIEQLKTDVYGKHWEDQSWHEVLRLICGMIDERWANEIILYVIEIENPILILPVVTATQYLSECGNLSLLGGTSEIIMHSVFKIFEKNFLEMPDHWIMLLNRELGKAAKTIGTNWPNRHLLESMLDNVSIGDGADEVATCIGDFVGSIGQGLETVRKKMLSFIERDNYNFRIFGISALAVGFTDHPHTQDVLRNAILNDRKRDVQKVAINTVADFYHEKHDTFSLLCDRAKNSTYSGIRRIALEKLIKYYPDDPITLSIFHDRAVNDESPIDKQSEINHGRVRSFAIETVLAQWPKHPDTITLLCERAVNEKYGYMRRDAVSLLGKNYYEDARVPSLLRERAVKDNDPDVRSVIMWPLAEHYRQDAQVIPFLQERVVRDDNAEVRRAIVRAMAISAHESDQSLPLLKGWAVNSIHIDVRKDALLMLAIHYHEDAQVLQLLSERAVQDESKIVRSATMLAMVDYYAEDSQVFPLLKEYTEQSTDSEIRCHAISALAKYYRDNAQTVLLLQKHAEHDNDPDARGTAILALGKHYYNDSHILPFLQKCAVNDDSPKHSDPLTFTSAFYSFQRGNRNIEVGYVRDTAIEVIAKYWPNHPDTLALLRERAENDPTPWLRERCKELIEEIEGKKENHN